MKISDLQFDKKKARKREESAPEMSKHSHWELGVGGINT